jgi:hypothetical protein
MADTSAAHRHVWPPPSPQVTLSFYERRQRQAWFGAKDERLYWEQW